MAIEDALAPWLGNQRWFAGKGQGTRDLAIVADTRLVAGDPELRHLIIAVSHGAAVDYYQILVGLRRRLPERLEYARIGPIGGGPGGGGLAGGKIAYDALHDADLTKPILAAIADDASVGPLRMRKIEGASFETGLYDDRNVKRAELGIASLFGIKTTGPHQTRVGNGFMARIERPHRDLSFAARR